METSRIGGRHQALHIRDTMTSRLDIFLLSLADLTQLTDVKLDDFQLTDLDSEKVTETTYSWDPKVRAYTPISTRNLYEPEPIKGDDSSDPT